MNFVGQTPRIHVNFVGDFAKNHVNFVGQTYNKTYNKKTYSLKRLNVDKFY
ncbi:hypothetical protein GCM10028806_00070 [Spirosoma terrae]